MRCKTHFFVFFAVRLFILLVCSQLDDNGFTGILPSYIANLRPRLRYLFLANNQFCYSAAYNQWSSHSDYSPSFACSNCPGLCQNGGVCSAGYSERYCSCPFNFTGPTCSISRISPPPGPFMFVAFEASNYFTLVCGIVALTALLFFLLRKQLLRLLLAIAGVLRTAFARFKLLPFCSFLAGTPSYFRGFAAICVTAAVLFIFFYQIQNLLEFNKTDPSGLRVALSLVLFQSPVTCDPSAFTLTFAAGKLSGQPTSCLVDSGLDSVTLYYSFPSPITFTAATTSNVTFTASSANNVPLFTHGISYDLTITTYQGNGVKMWETLTNDLINDLTGDLTVDLSEVTQGYLLDPNIQPTDFSPNIEIYNVTLSPSLVVTFKFPMPI